MKKLSLEDSMDHLKPKIVESFKSKDYDSLVGLIKQYRALEHYVDAIEPLRKRLER
ncbi:MAG: hypothetical protein V1645_01580 [archaeon]